MGGNLLDADSMSIGSTEHGGNDTSQAAVSPNLEPINPFSS